MNRLTKHSRGVIEDKLLHKALDERVAALIVKRAAFALKVYNDFYSDADRKKMAALPEGWLKTDNTIGVKFGESFYHLNYDGSFSSSNLFSFCKRPAVIELARFAKDHGNKVYERKSAMATEFSLLKREQDDIETAYTKLRKDIRAQTYAFTTMEKLLEHWPELTPIVTAINSKVERPAGMLVPAVAPLNKALGL